MRNEINSPGAVTLLSASHGARRASTVSRRRERNSRSFSPAFTLDDDGDDDGNGDGDRRDRGENSLRRCIKSRMIYACAK